MSVSRIPDLSPAPPAPQDEVLEFLARPQSYTPQPERVERMETHAAVVFLAGSEVYKVKKAVRLPYLDFSTLARRKHFCEREMSINRRNAPDLYLGVVPVNRKPDGGLVLGGAGTPVEWTVHMRRFDQSSLLQAVVDRGELDRGLVDRLAAAVLSAHKQAERAADSDSVTAMAGIVHQLADAFSAHGAVLGADEVHRFRELSHARLRAARPSLEFRAKRGFVRRCHGDLHLGNIVVLDGKPILFDALEFDEGLATIDLLYDLAFLLMDLVEHGHREDANRLLNRYLFLSGTPADLQGLAALPLFLGCRAGVRAVVALERADQGGQGLEAGRRLAHSALHYLAAPEPRLLAVGGFSGTGKSTLAAALAPGLGPEPGAVLLRSDLERKAMFKVHELSRLGERHYTQTVSDQVYQSLFDKAKTALRAGHSVILDAVFAKPSERAAAEAAAREAHVPFLGLWLTAPMEDLVARVEARTRDASDATAMVVEAQMARGTGPVAWNAIDASHSAEVTLETARAALGRWK